MEASWYIAVATCGLNGGNDDIKWSGGVLDRKVSSSSMAPKQSKGSTHHGCGN